MTVQWVFVAGFLYAEVFVVLLLVLPIVSPRKWNQFFKSKFFTALGRHGSWYFMVIFSILIIFLLEAIREIKKYSESSIHDHAHSHLDSEMQSNMRLFRAQRNFYISGFSLFLWLVIRRLISLITTLATVKAECEAALSQARNASAAAEVYFKSKDEDDEQVATNESNKIKELEDKVAELKNELNQTVIDKKAVMSQADSVSKEYDRLLKEYDELQKKLVSSSTDKKNE